MQAVNQYYRALKRDVTPPSADPFIMTFTLGASDSITLPLINTGTYSFDVDWGDGSSDTITVWNQAERTHVYTGLPSGDYVVKITGICTIFNFVSVSTSRLKIKSVDQWGDPSFVGLSFGLCTNLISVATGLKFLGASLGQAFQDCPLTSLPVGFLEYCPNLTTVANTFLRCPLTSLPSGLFDNCPSIISFFRTFKDCDLTSLPSGLFDFCPNITDFTETFYRNFLTSLPSGLFDSCTEVTTFLLCFEGNLIDSLPSGLFNSCTKVIIFTSCFFNNKITSLPSGIFNNCTLVTSFANTFRQNLLTSIPSNIFNSCINVISYGSTFYLNPSLGLNISSFVSGMDFTKVTTTGNMFAGCVAITGLGQDLIDKPKDAGYTVGTGSSSGSYRTFQNCISLTDFATIPADYK